MTYEEALDLRDNLRAEATETYASIPHADPVRKKQLVAKVQHIQAEISRLTKLIRQAEFAKDRQTTGLSVDDPAAIVACLRQIIKRAVNEAGFEPTPEEWAAMDVGRACAYNAKYQKAEAAQAVRERRATLDTSAVPHLMAGNKSVAQKPRGG